MFESEIFIEACGRRGQDRAAVIPHAQGIVAVVADGAGGTSGGDEAADMLTLWVRAFATRETDIRNPAAWGELLMRVDAQIACANGQTTGVIVAAFEGGLAGASVGDSAAWLIDDDGIDDLTAEQVHKPLLGTGAARPMTFSRTGFSGTLLLASDGLVKYAKRDRIAIMARSADLQAATRALADLTRLQSGGLNDDVAVALCRWKAGQQSVPNMAERERYLLDE